MIGNCGFVEFLFKPVNTDCIPTSGFEVLQRIGKQESPPA